MKKHSCIVVADSARARFFKVKVKGRQRFWEEYAALQHPETRVQGHDLTSDRSGRALNSVGAGRHGMAENTEARDHEAKVFACQVFQELKSQEPLETCEKIALVAPPQFLGLLRKQLSHAYLNKVAWELDKNLDTQNVSAIRQHAPTGW